MILTFEETEILKHVLIDHEGMKLFPYLDCCGKAWRTCTCKEKGKLTLGIGRNLDDVGITESEAIELEMNDIQRCAVYADKAYPWFCRLSSARRVVIISMLFNLGFAKFKKFSKMIKQIEIGDFRRASFEMLNSAWATQVKGRASRLSILMQTGTF